MKAEDLKNKTSDELQKALLDLKKQQLNLRLQKSQGQLANSAQVRIVRRDIARIQTQLSALKKGAAPAAVKKAPKAKTTKTKKAAA